MAALPALATDMRRCITSNESARFDNKAAAFILAGLTQQLRSELAALERDIALPCGGPFGTQGRWGPNGREPGVRDLIRRSERERQGALVMMEAAE
jgi:hypothetical protein